jgi:hypothetical protein
MLLSAHVQITFCSLLMWTLSSLSWTVLLVCEVRWANADYAITSIMVLSAWVSWRLHQPNCSACMCFFDSWSFLGCCMCLVYQLWERRMVFQQWILLNSETFLQLKEHWCHTWVIYCLAWGNVVGEGITYAIL